MAGPLLSTWDEMRAVDPVRRLLDLADELCAAVDAAGDDVGGHRGSLAILADIGKASDEARAALAAKDAEIARLRRGARAMLRLRSSTKTTHEAAYDAMFKSAGADAWNMLIAALSRARVDEGLEWAIELILQDACELPDRSSPEGQPEMLLITCNELEMLLRRHLGLEDAALASTSASPGTGGEAG